MCPLSKLGLFSRQGIIKSPFGIPLFYRKRIFYGTETTWYTEKRVSQLIQPFNKCLLSIFCMMEKKRWIGPPTPTVHLGPYMWEQIVQHSSGARTKPRTRSSWNTEEWDTHLARPLEKHLTGTGTLDLFMCAFLGLRQEVTCYTLLMAETEAGTGNGFILQCDSEQEETDWKKKNQTLP